MKPLAPISLDLDNKWSYLMTYGDPAWRDYPSFLELVVPRVLDLLDERGTKITFFVVGRDAAMPQHRDVLAEIARRGHRIGNHSHDHNPWLHSYSDADLKDEIDRSDAAIRSATGATPIGFRAPGYSVSASVLRLLAANGYRYDASVFPNILNPLSRAYYFAKSNLSDEEKQQRKALFGNLSSALRPNRAHLLEVDEATTIIEVPVTTFPLVRTPIHMSYVGYLAGKARWLASTYFRLGLLSCRSTRNPPSMLLHGTDFLGADDEKDMSFFPGMQLASGVKVELAHHFLDLLESHYELVPIETFVDSVELSKSYTPDYAR